MSTVIAIATSGFLVVFMGLLWSVWRADPRNVKPTNFYVTVQQQAPEHWTVAHPEGGLPIQLVIQALAVHACAIAQNTGTDVDAILDAAREVIHSPDIDMHVEFPGL